MYRPMMLCPYMDSFYNSSSGASALCSIKKVSHLRSVALHSIYISILWSRTLHPTMHRQERLPNTHLHCHIGLQHSGKETFSKPQSSLHNSRVQLKHRHPHTELRRCIISPKTRNHEFVPRDFSLSWTHLPVLSLSTSCYAPFTVLNLAPSFYPSKSRI